MNRGRNIYVSLESVNVLWKVCAAVVIAVALLPVPAFGQSRLISMRTTEQSLAITCSSSMCQNLMPELVEAYDYDMVEVHPSFPGGTNAMIQYINSTRVYPMEAYSNGIEGRVLCSFIVRADGRISHVNVLKGIEPTLDREAVRIIHNMPSWDVGMMGGIAVPVYCILPIMFRR